MTLEAPWALAILVPFIIAIAISFLRGKGRKRGGYLVAVCRSLVVASLAIALGRPHIVETTKIGEITALLDTSSSMTGAQGERLLAKASSLAQALGVPMRVVPFARRSGSAINDFSSYDSVRSGSATLDPSATNLEAALASLRATTGQIAFLLSDGYESVGHALSALASGDNPRIFPFSVDGEPEPQGISITQLYAPQVVKSQQRADVRVSLANSLSVRAEGTLIVTHGSAKILERVLTIPSNQEVTVSTESDPKIEGLQPIVATYSWRDSTGTRSVSRTSWLSSEKRDKVLLLSGSPDDDRFLSRILRGQSYQLRDEIASPTLPTSLDPLSDYRAIILNNVPASSLPPQLLQSVNPYVKGGGSLVTIGGDRSYGLGGYIGSAVEEILPVRLVPPHVEKKRLTVAVQLVIDKSRSMAMDARLEFAKAAAREVLASLKDDDFIGVIGFDDVPFIALPISQVGPVRYSAADRISRLYPTKKTNLFPALDEARRGMARVNAGRKHVIVLTDGKLPDPGTYYFDLVRQMRVLGVTLSTVVVGADADDGFLANLAKLGGGSFYQTSDPTNLPKIFLSDVKVASDEKSIRENPEIKVSRGPSGVSSTSLSDFPTLRGFVETLPRDSARTELIVSEEGRSFPLLASWQVGKGRACSFTSDANGRWSSRWIEWPSINEFWSDIVESTISTSGKARSNIDFELRSWVEGGEVVVDLSVFQEAGASTPRGEVTLPSSERVPLGLREISPGHYQGRLQKAVAGKYTASVLIGDAALPQIAWEISEDSFSERPRFKPNTPLLQQIASRSGGIVNPDKEALAKQLEVATNKRDLSRIFASIALLLFLLEIICREFNRLSRSFGRSAG